MTGLDLERDALIEVAVLVTDSELNQLGDGVDVVIACPPEALESMPPVVREMHEALREFARAHPGQFQVDTRFTDLFGYNSTFNFNGYLRKR